MELTCTANRLAYDLVELKVRTASSTQRIILLQAQAERLLAELTIATLAPPKSSEPA